MCMPRRRASTLTSAYSSSAANTNTRHIDIHTSIALTYETRGSDALMNVDWVVVVSTVSRPMMVDPRGWSRHGVGGPVVTSRRVPAGGQQADGDASRTGVDVEPERHPGQDDDQRARHVELYDEVADVPDQHEPNLEAWERTCDIHTHTHTAGFNCQRSSTVNVKARYETNAGDV